MPAASPAGPFGLHLLDMGTVLQHDAEQVAGGRRAENLPGKPGLDQPGQQAGMVDVGVGQQDEIQLFRLVDARIEVAPFDGFIALMHAAVDGKAYGSGVDHVAGTGDGAGRAEKLDFHAASDGWPTRGVGPVLRSVGETGSMRPAENVGEPAMYAMAPSLKSPQPKEHP